MSDEKKYSLTEAQQQFAKSTNHRVWDLLDLSSRTEGEEEELLLAANASLFHWLQVGTAVHAQRGHWMLSRVHVVLGRKDDALNQALRCQAITESNPDEMEDFDLAFAQEALARAYALAGDLNKARKHHQKAVALGEAIKDQEDQKIFLGDFQGGEWFGLT
jgi:tetratricopeptide (TPR) repeat protein